MRGVQVLFVTTVMTYTAQYDCEILAHAFGGSGSGAVIRGQFGTATGGGAGARCTKRIKLKAGDVITLTPGAGGVTVPIPSGAANGGDGTDTTITGPGGLNMIAGGGKGGNAGISNSLTNVLGGAGGIATGGDENVTGGRGGNANASTDANHSRATGGGALPLLDVGHRGGDFIAACEGSATGGGGVGGRGGDVVGSLVSSASTGGGSAFGDAPDLSTGTVGAGGPDKPIGALDVPLASWFQLSGGGGMGGTSGPAAPHGGGSGGVIATNATSAPVAAFGGSGGVRIGSGSGSSGAGTGVPFGGSGGACSPSTQGVNAAPGGSGFIVLEFLS